jgi:hypothetical protein
MDKILPDFRQEDCPICVAPEKATWRERFDHGCAPLEGERIRQCVWCGEPHLNPGGPEGGAMWCSEGCHDAHEAANPGARYFKGWINIAETLPGGKHDGVWENSGLSFEAPPSTESEE